MKSFDLRTMVESHSWTWLLDLARHLNIAIDIVDDQCVPLLPIDESDASADAAALRGLLATEASPLRSTISLATPSDSPAVAINNRLCVCCGLSPAGTVVVARNTSIGNAAAEESRLELAAIGTWLAGAIEGSLANGPLDAIEDSHMVASLRRLLDEAVERGSVRGVVSAFVETLAVWLEIEVHGYVGVAPGRFFHALAPVGADHSSVPAALDDDVVPAGTAMVRLSSSETERFEFTSVPDDVLVRSIATDGRPSWVIVFAGTIDRHDEARLTALSDLCRDALNALALEPIMPAEAALAEDLSSPAAGSDRGERRRAHRPFQAWIERLASQTIEEGGQASVIVISIPDEDVRPEYIHAQVVKVRNELRPSDFAGSLAGGEIGVLLRDTPADQAAAVSARLEKLLQWDVNTGKAIQPSIGMVSCSPDSPCAGSILRAARENGAARAIR
jgi:hypothetical protein